ncbi:hypothetical protein [Glaciibacter flavus]|uniref:hypothetical protein n=1 Tax=Orlajensenia flava TaxID=2565934 RepID=UPI003B004417
MSVFPIGFDPDVWVRVPTDWQNEAWPDAAVWAAWVAEELTRARENAAHWNEVLREEAARIAGFPADRISARFWYFPIDGEPRGWVDVFVQRRDADGTDAVDLLPDAGATLIEPAIDLVDDEGFTSAARRLTLVPLGESSLGAGRSGILSKAEWTAVAGDWIVYLVSFDTDPRRLTARLLDIETLLGGINPEVLAALPEAAS